DVRSLLQQVNDLETQSKAAQAKLEQAKAKFNTVDIQRNPFFVQNACTNSTLFSTTSVVVSKLSIERAFADQQALLKKCQSLGNQHLLTSQQAHAVNSTADYLKAQSDYWT